MLNNTELRLLARDMAVLTVNGFARASDIAAAYGIPYPLPPEVATHTVYRQEEAKWTRRLSDETAILREQAKLLVANNLTQVQLLLADPGLSPQHRVALNRMLMELGDLMPKKDDTNVGITVMLDYGPAMNARLPSGREAISVEGEVLDAY